MEKYMQDMLLNPTQFLSTIAKENNPMVTVWARSLITSTADALMPLGKCPAALREVADSILQA